MTTINFPTSPELDQVYNSGDKSWVWNGKGWRAVHEPRSTDAELRDRANHTGTQDASTIVGLTDWQANPTGVQSINGGQLAGFRNKIINGAMGINQYASPYYVANVPTNQAGYSVDRWLTQITSGSSGGGTSTQTTTLVPFTPGQIIVPGEPTSHLRFQVTGVGTVGGVSAAARVVQRIEDVRTLAGQTATLSFYAKADANRPCAVVLGQSFGAGGSENAGTGQIINLTTTWAKYSVAVTLPSIAGKTVGAGSSLEATLFLYKADNDIYNDTLGPVGTWAAGQYLDLAMVQLEAGDTATQFEHRPPGLERMLCQRYFETGRTKLFIGYSINGLAVSSKFVARKRVAPTVQVTGGAAQPTNIEWVEADVFSALRSGAGVAEIDFYWSAFADF